MRMGGWDSRCLLMRGSGRGDEELSESLSQTAAGTYRHPLVSTCTMR